MVRRASPNQATRLPRRSGRPASTGFAKLNTYRAEAREMPSTARRGPQTRPRRACRFSCTPENARTRKRKWVWEPRKRESAKGNGQRGNRESAKGRKCERERRRKVRVGPGRKLARGAMLLCRNAAEAVEKVARNPTQQPAEMGGILRRSPNPAGPQCVSLQQVATPFRDTHPPKVRETGLEPALPCGN